MFRLDLRYLLTVLVVALLLVPVTAGTHPAVAAPNRVSALTFATGESSGAPQNASDHFDVGTGRVYAFFDYSGVGPDEPIVGTWYQGGRVMLTQSETLGQIFKDSTAPDSGTIWFYANVNGGFSPGLYRLEVRVSDQVAQTGEFRVEPRQGQAVLANTTFSDKVSDSGDNVHYPVQVRTQFPDSTQQVYAIFDHFGMDAAKSWGWRLSSEGVVLDEQQNQSWTDQPEGTYALPLRVPGDPGVYDLDLFVNDQWVDAESFVIGQPKAPADRLLHSDEFTDPSSGWGTATIGGNSVRYAAGQYRVVVAGDQPVWGTSGKDFRDGVAQIQAALVNVPSNVKDGAAWDSYGYLGLVARWQDKDNYYSFIVSPNGQYAIYHLLDGNLVWDTRWTQALRDVFEPGLQARTLRMLANGAVLRFYIDGRLIGVAPQAIWDHGQTGVIAGPLGSTRRVEAAFQHFNEWSLPQ